MVMFKRRLPEFQSNIQCFTIFGGRIFLKSIIFARMISDYSKLERNQFKYRYISMQP